MGIGEYLTTHTHRQHRAWEEWFSLVNEIQEEAVGGRKHASPPAPRTPPRTKKEREKELARIKGIWAMGVGIEIPKD